MPNTRVQAELQMPSMMTRSLRSRMRWYFAVIAGDMQIGARRRHSQQREQQQGQKRDAHGSIENRVDERKIGPQRTRRHDSGGTVLEFR
jgi:hypothetical protein